MRKLPVEDLLCYLDQIRSQMIKKVLDNTIPKASLKEEMAFTFIRASTLGMYKFLVN